MKNDSTNEGIGKTSAAKSFDLPNYLVSEPTHINIGRSIKGKDIKAIFFFRKVFY